ncbi:MMPL family transporter [Angustibacter aerolatus]
MERFQGGDGAHGFFGPPARALGRLVGPRVKWVVVALGLAASAAVFALAGAGEVAPGATTLPASAESVRAAAVQATLPASEVQPLFVVLSRDGRLAEADRSAAAAALLRALDAVRAQGALPTGGGGAAAPDGLAVQVSDDGTTALTVVPLRSDLDDDATGRAVDAVRVAVRRGVPQGLDVAVTGGPVFTTDIGKVFDGADVTLLAATAGVVALLLLITYRSPWLWLVPLGVVGLGDQVASRATDALSRVTDVSADGAVKGIVSVLVFGAGTNYALLVIARYREELRLVDDRHDAMRRALESAAPAVLASSSTVVLALLGLGLARDTFVTSLGYSGALGIAIALAFALLLLPATLVLFGRNLFWPFVPRVGQPDPSRTGLWRRVGERVTRRPAAVVAGGVVVLAALTAGGVGIAVAQTPTEQFLQRPESVAGQEQLARAFPAGSSQPTLVVAPVAAAGEVQRALPDVDSVSSVRRAGADDRSVAFDVVLGAQPGSDAAFTAVRALRDAVHPVGGLVGGSDAELLDTSTTADRDRALLLPLVLGIVLVVLLLLLRSVVAAVLLVATVVATFVASTGASWFAFDHLLGYPPLADSTPLLAFLFLVALGVDYNIFLTTRAREEASGGADARSSIVTALAVTGGVITSAGILLAAVFAVLGVLPLVQLAQIGVIVGFGVLLDTLVVRSLIVPARVSLLGERFWWPSHPRRP